MIEYDKATATTSYPSLTDDEQAAILDKAYLAVIAQKFTGNNTRRSAFETDIKSVSDLQPLIKDVKLGSDNQQDFPITNVIVFTITSGTKFLYFVNASLIIKNEDTDTNPKYTIPLKLVSHSQAEKFFKTEVNNPWIKYPVCFLQDNKFYVVIDNSTLTTFTNRQEYKMYLNFVEAPATFKGKKNSTSDIEVNDQLAEEIISTAVLFALENVESPRLTAKIQTKGLEA